MEPPGTNPVFNKNHRSTAIPVAKFPAGKPAAAHIPPAHQPPAKHPTAKPNRQWEIASEIISEVLAAGEIRRTVVISYGTNAGVYDAELVRQAIKQLEPDRMILLVNLYSPSTFAPESNQILAYIADQYANVKLVDWHQAVSQHPEWLHVDQTHPNMTGAVKMGELVRKNIDEMSAELTALKAKQKQQRERASAPNSRKKR